MQSSGTYLVCVDKNESSHVALHFACKKALRSGCTVKILHVISPEDVNNLFGVMNKVREEQRQIAEALVQQLVSQCAAYGDVAISYLIGEGKIGEEIISAIAEDTAINLLIMGAASANSGNINLIHWLTEKLGNRILIPMMVVPGNLTDLQIDELM